MSMSELDPEAGRFTAFVEEIDELIGQYDPGELAPDRIVRDILNERAAQRTLLDQIVEKTTTALTLFPRNGALLRRRAFAYARVVTEDLEYPFVDHAVRDLQTILVFEPSNTQGVLDLAQELFTFSELESSEVASMCAELAVEAERTLLETIALQVRALLHDDRKAEATELWTKWTRLFPDDEDLSAAIREFE